MKDLLLSLASPELLISVGFLLLALGLLGEVAVLVEPLESHRSHKLIGFACAAIVLVGYVVGHIGEDAIATRSQERAARAEERIAELQRISPRIVSEAD